MIRRRKTRKVGLGNLFIGGDAPILIQSMIKVPTRNTRRVIAQIERLEECGCEAVRLAITGAEDISSLKKIKKSTKIPLIADIQFHTSLALKSIEAGADKIRLNPGNMKKKGLKEIACLSKERGIPMRIGANSGSIKIKKRGLAVSLVDVVGDWVKFFEDIGFLDLVISLKTTEVESTISAYRMMAKRCKYPFHLGITESGMGRDAVIKSSLGIGILLQEGIGDTIRVSLTEAPEEEVKVAQEILQSLGIRFFHPEIISCPTCGRCEINLPKIVKEVKKKLSKFKTTKSLRAIAKQSHGIATSSASGRLLAMTPTLKIAIMGCVVNGPGEAKQADIGIAGGKKNGMLFKKGKPVRKIKEENLVKELLKEIKK